MAYEIKCDTHTHTLYSRHAYSTIEENVRAAKAQGLELLASTDHFSAMQWAEPDNIKNYQYLTTCDLWPREWHGVTLLRGCEADIIDLDGSLYGDTIKVTESIVGDPYPEPSTLYEYATKKFDYVIASVHGKQFTIGAGTAALTEMYIRALCRPNVLILGHIGRSGLSVDIDPILSTAKSLHKLIEINEHSFGFGGESLHRCRSILVRCAELNVPISISTDAHISYDIGKFDKVQQLLQDVHFPEELIASRDRKHFLRALKDAGLRDLTALDH